MGPAVEEHVVRHALSRGFLAQPQLREALLLREQLQRSGRPADLLAILRARYLRPECLAELSTVYQQALGGATFAPPSAGSGTLALPPGDGADAPTVAGGILPQPAAIPDSAVWRSAELLARPSGEDPVAVRQFLNRTREVRVHRQVPLWQIGLLTLAGGLTVGGVGVAIAFVLRGPPSPPPVAAKAKTLPAKTEEGVKAEPPAKPKQPEKVQPARKHFERGRRLQDRGANDEAFAAYTRAVELNPRLGAAWRHRAEIRVKLNDNRGAVKDCDQAIAAWPKDAASWETRGVAKWELNDLEGAAFDLARAIELDANRGRAWFHLGGLRSRNHDLEGAQEATKRAIELEPRKAMYRVQLAEIFKALGKPKEARKELNRAVVLEPTFAPARGSRGMSLIGSQEYAAALADFQRASELEPKQALWWYGRGLALSRMGKYREAKVEFERALELHQGRHEFWGGRGVARKGLRDLKGAEADFDQAIKLGGNRKKKGASYHFHRGTIRSKLRNYPGAIADLTRSLQLDPTSGKAWFFLGLTYEHQRKYDRALKAFLQALKRKSLVSAWRKLAQKHIAKLRRKLGK